MRKIGKDDEAKLLRARSDSYRNLFDKTHCFMRPKLESGKFEEPFNPKEIQISKKWKDFTESNAWQETFANQHDLASYIPMFGGRQAFVAKLDALFNQPSTLPADTPPDVAGLVGMYAHGNEPSHHVAYLYCYGGAPWKTQARIRSFLETMYHDDPDGMAGNEDCGQMSAWYVMSALGFYPVDPASGNYVLGSPLFERAAIRLGPGRELVITAPGNSADIPYLDSWQLNGTPKKQVWFHDREIRGGAEIRFVMAKRPNPNFGAETQDAPPTLA
jgi:predicted alpha-1,2-mannosidase